MIKLKTTDGVEFEINQEIAKKFILISMIMEVTCNGTKNTTDPSSSIPVLVKSAVLRKVLNFVQNDHYLLSSSYNPLEIYFSPDNLQFFDEFTTEEILEICNAANYLNYPFLLELTSKVLALRLESQTGSEIAKIFKGEIKEEPREIIESEYGWLNEDY